MLVGVFIPNSSLMLRELVVGQLSQESDLDVQPLEPDPETEGRTPIGGGPCSVIVFVSSPGGARTVDDLHARVGQNCVELIEDGRRAVAWTIAATAQAQQLDGPGRLSEVVRRAGTQVRAT